MTTGQGQPPRRRLRVLFLGAGASKAAGLPLTEELLERIYPRSGTAKWHDIRSPGTWRHHLSRAIIVLYPDGRDPAFRPSAVDFFTMLEVMASVHAGRARVPLDARELLAALRSEIAGGVQGEVAQLELNDVPHAAWLTSPNRPDVVVTSNWDTLAERAADEAGLEVRLSWPRQNDGDGQRRDRLRANEVVILKLHGSADWGEYGNRSVQENPLKDYYADLRTPLWRTTSFGRARQKAEKVLRFRSIEGARSADDGQVGFSPPLMATMAVGKQTQIDALEELWDDAYWSISRAAALDIVGYSFPADDLELRALFRAGTRRAGRADLDDGVAVAAVNPSPDAHERARGFLGAGIGSDYRSADAWAPS